MIAEEARPSPDAPRRTPRARRLVLAAAVCVLVSAACRSGSGSTLPARLSDEEFWTLSADLSEPAGTFTHSDNLVSNETEFVHLLRMLRPEGGVYIGVGPEQNYSYIARLEPAMAFIVDIRRQNRNLHLLYKALFELSTDRADFVSRLFSRERPRDVGGHTPIQDLFAQYERSRRSGALYEATVRAVRERLLGAHAFALEPDDLEWVEYALHAFYSDGPDIHYGRSRPDDAPGPSYRELMTASDVGGISRSYLGSEAAFSLVKDLHARNLIVPVVGDFSGPTAIRRVGDYAKRHNTTVVAFYASNVEVYLTRKKTDAFCSNLAALPHDSRSWFVRSKRMQRFSSRVGECRGSTGFY